MSGASGVSGISPIKPYGFCDGNSGKFFNMEEGVWESNPMCLSDNKKPKLPLPKKLAKPAKTKEPKVEFKPTSKAEVRPTTVGMPVAGGIFTFFGGACGSTTPIECNDEMLILDDAGNREVVANLNMGFSNGEYKFEVKMTIPPEGEPRMIEALKNGSLWIYLGSNGFKPEGKAKKVDGFLILKDRSNGSYVSIRPMKDLYFGEQVYEYQGQKVVKHLYRDWENEIEEWRYYKVDNDGYVICEKDSSEYVCDDIADAEDNGVTVDVEDETELKLVYEYYRVNSNGEYIGEGEPVPIPASEKPAERDYEVVIDESSTEEVPPLSVPLKYEIVLTDEKGRAEKQEKEGTLANLGQIEPFKINSDFYDDATVKMKLKITFRPDTDDMGIIGLLEEYAFSGKASVKVGISCEQDNPPLLDAETYDVVDLVDEADIADEADIPLDEEGNEIEEVVEEDMAAEEAEEAELQEDPQTEDAEEEESD